MICLTGDLHHMSPSRPATRPIAISPRSRWRPATSRCSKRPTSRSPSSSPASRLPRNGTISSLSAKTPLSRWAGHTYYCFTPELWHRVWNKLIGSYNGPAWYQRWDIAKTARIVREHCGVDIASWRNHMYMHGPYTEECLKACNVRICSDGVKKDSAGPERHPSGVFNLPLNVMPDHEHLYHARTHPGMGRAMGSSPQLVRRLRPRFVLRGRMDRARRR